MQKWEYDTFDIPADSEGIYALLNDLANEGWELVAVDNRVGYFKRPFNVKRTIPFDEYVKSRPDYKGEENS